MVAESPIKVIVESQKLTFGFKKPYLFAEKDMDLRLAQMGAKSPEAGDAVLRISIDGQRSIAKVWQMGKVEIYYDPLRGFLSAEGLDPPSVAKTFTDLHSLSVELLGAPIDQELKWAELNAAARAQGLKSPLESLAANHGNGWIASFQKVLGMNLRPFALVYYASESPDLNQPLREVPDWTHLKIEPFSANPSYYSFGLVYRKKDIQKVAKMGSQFQSVVEDAISSIEGK